MASDDDRLRPAWYGLRDALEDDGLAEDGASEDVADLREERRSVVHPFRNRLRFAHGTVRRLPHLLELELCIGGKIS